LINLKESRALRYKNENEKVGQRNGTKLITALPSGSGTDTILTRVHYVGGFQMQTSHIKGDLGRNQE